jgi:hypothetical protein
LITPAVSNPSGLTVGEAFSGFAFALVNYTLFFLTFTGSSAICICRIRQIPLPRMSFLPALAIDAPLLLIFAVLAYGFGP